MQEVLGYESPGVGRYNVKVNIVKESAKGIKFGSGNKFDMYSFVKDATKSPGPVYAPKIVDGISDNRQKGVSEYYTNK